MKKFLHKLFCKCPLTTRQAAKNVAEVVRPDLFFRVSDSVDRFGNSKPIHRYEVLVVTPGGTSILSSEPTLEFTVTKALAAYRVTI